MNTFGSWKVNQSTATGFFRVEKKGDRWWIIDPEDIPSFIRELLFFVRVVQTIRKPL